MLLVEISESLTDGSRDEVFGGPRRRVEGGGRGGGRRSGQTLT